MSNSVLVFEENKAIQGLIASTISDQVELWQESRPDAFLQLADRYSPSLIFISNVDQQQDYALCRQLQQHSALSQVPKVLLVNARDDVNESLLEQFGLQGMIRKPFEAATLQEHIQRYLPSVELQSEPADSAEEINVFDDEMLGLIQDNGESVDEQTMFDEDTGWSGSATGDLPEEDDLDEESAVSLPNVSHQAAAPKQIRPPVVEEDSVPDVDFADDIAEEEELNADETEIIPSVAVEEDLNADKAEMILSAETDSSDEDEEIQSLDELLGVEAAMEEQPGLVQHDDMVLNAKEGLSLVDLEGEIMDSEQNEIEETLTGEASAAESETDTATEEAMESEESEGPFADLDLDFDGNKELLDATALDNSAEKLTEESAGAGEKQIPADSDGDFDIPPTTERPEDKKIATDASEEPESITNDSGFEIPPLELDEEQDLTLLAEEWEEPLSSEEDDDDMEIPPLGMTEEEEDLLGDHWQGPAAEVLSEEVAETEEAVLAPDDIAEDDDFALFEEIDDDDWKEAAIAAKAEVEAAPTLATVVISPVKDAYRGPIVTSAQGLVMDNIDIHQNDFDVDWDIWSRIPDVDQILRGDVTPILLNENDFDPVLPTALSTVEIIQGPLRTRYTPNVSEMDYYLAATTLEDEELAETLLNNDSMLLMESGEATDDGGLAAALEDFEATTALAIGADDEELEEFQLTMEDDDELVLELEEEEFALVEEKFPDSSTTDLSVEEDLLAEEEELPDLFAETDWPLLNETEESDVTELASVQEEAPVAEKKKWRRQVFEQDLEELQPSAPAEEEIAPEEEIELPVVEDEFLTTEEVDDSEEVSDEDKLAAESMLSELEDLDQEMAVLEQQEVELTEIPEDEALVNQNDERSSNLMTEGEPEVLEEETFEDWGDAVEALEEESEEVVSAEPEGEMEVLEEETFEDWGDAVEALEEESSSPLAAEVPALAASEATEVPAGMGSLDTVIEGMIIRSVQKAVADAMPQIVERIVQELRQPRP
jgi:hypothetical protein